MAGTWAASRWPHTRKAMKIRERFRHREAETAHGERESPSWGAMDTRKMVTGGVGLLPWHEDRNASYRLRERP